MKRRDLTYLSFGAGVQSTALLICSNLGLHGVPRADVAIFADTGDEPAWVYDTLKRMQEWSEIPVEVVQKGHLLQDAYNRQQGTTVRFAGIPMFTPAKKTAGEAMLRRQCTREYKIEVIEKRVRELMGYEPRQRIKHAAVAMIGISLDEVVRMKPGRTRWITNTWPLVAARLRREACLKITQDELGFTPLRSSCVYCPYHSDSYWQMMKADHPDEFDKACAADEQLRDMEAQGINGATYVHRSLVPLREARLKGDDQPSLFGDFTAECEGMCGV